MPGNFFGSGWFVEEIGLPEHDVWSEDAFDAVHDCGMCTQVVDGAVVEVTRFLFVDVERTFGFKDFVLDEGANFVHFFGRVHRVRSEVSFVVEEADVFGCEVIRLGHINALFLHKRSMPPATNHCHR